jgi:hypothetical protein
MRNRWTIYVLALVLAVTGYVLLSPRIALADGDVGNVSVYVYHDVNRDGIWNWGEVAPPNMRGDYNWQWDRPATHPSGSGPVEIALVGAGVQLKYYQGESGIAPTFHDGPAQFALPIGTQVVDVGFRGTGDGRKWIVTNRSQKTVNEPADSQFAFNFPLPPTGPNSMHVILIGVTLAPECDCDHQTCHGCQAHEDQCHKPACGTCCHHEPAHTTYVIQSGDTLWKIAQAFGTTVDALASANGIANPDLIYAGATLIIP